MDARPLHLDWVRPSCKIAPGLSIVSSSTRTIYSTVWHTRAADVWQASYWPIPRLIEWSRQKYCYITQPKLLYYCQQLLQWLDLLNLDWTYRRSLTAESSSSSNAWLISGGTGALGLLSGAYLLESGAQEICLLGRTGRVANASMELLLGSPSNHHSQIINVTRYSISLAKNKSEQLHLELWLSF